MMHRVFVVAAILSAILLAATIFLLVNGSRGTDLREHCVRITDDCYIAACLGNIAFFNCLDYGPYRGSVVQISDEKGNAFPRMEETAFGPACGIYYRHFHWLDSDGVLWTLMLSAIYPLVVFSILPTVWFWLRWRKIHHPAADCILE